MKHSNGTLHDHWEHCEHGTDIGVRGIARRSPSPRGVAEEASDAYQDVSAVVDASGAAGPARKVARLAPLICIKG